MLSCFGLSRCVTFHTGGAMGSFLRLLPERIVRDCPVKVFLLMASKGKKRKKTWMFFMKWHGIAVKLEISISKMHL